MILARDDDMRRGEKALTCYKQTQMAHRAELADIVKGLREIGQVLHALHARLLGDANLARFRSKGAVEISASMGMYWSAAERTLRLRQQENKVRRGNPEILSGVTGC